jgi:hypothetical protein
VTPYENWAGVETLHATSLPATCRFTDMFTKVFVGFYLLPGVKQALIAQPVQP